MKVSRRNVFKLPVMNKTVYTIGFWSGVVAFMVEMLALHHVVAPEKKFWSHEALLCTVIYVVFVTANYVVQLATVIPMTLNGAAGEIQLLRQTPHSLFWDFDAA